MIKLIIKRLLVSIILIFGLLTITFIIIRLAPGDPTAIYLSPNIHPDVAKQMRINLGLDEPIHVQYLKWIGIIHPFSGFLEGDFGYSFSRHKPVLTVIGEAIPNTLLLTLSAFLLNFIIGISLGIVSALNEKGKVDGSIAIVSTILYSMPEFWFGIILILLFSSVLGWFPSSQMHSSDADSFSSFKYVLDTLNHLIMPVFVLGVCSSASTIRYMRGSVLDILKKDYVLFARAKGLKEKEIFFHHIFKNSLIPIATLFGLYLPFLLGSSAVVEYVFAWPGLGRITIDSILARDYPVIIGITLITGVLVVIGNLISDVLNLIIDPRLRST
jgi:peptide/nickel transport system permease protein